jgi:hypothetical protein
MEAKEKAIELLNKMTTNADSLIYKNQYAKQCALIAVDEIIKFMEMDDEHNECLYFANSKWVQYLMEVKQEIEKL